MQVKGIRGARSIATGYYTSCAALRDGSVWCWGRNQTGELGTATPGLYSTPRRVPGLPKATAIYAGGSHFCALTTKKTLWCWGQWASPNNALRPFHGPTPMPGLRDITQAWAGHRFTCALNRRGEVRCWGDNAQGQLGRRPPPYRTTPVRLGPK